MKLIDLVISVSEKVLIGIFQKVLNYSYCKENNLSMCYFSFVNYALMHIFPSGGRYLVFLQNVME